MGFFPQIAQILAIQYSVFWIRESKQDNKKTGNWQENREKRKKEEPEDEQSGSVAGGCFFDYNHKL
jgi:hypothetical protein